MDLEKNGALWKDLCRGGLVLAAQAGTAVWAGVCRAGQAAGCAARGVRLGLRFLELRAGVNTQMRTIGAMVYATHSGTPTPSADLQQALEAADQLHEALQRVCLSRGSGFPGGTARTLTSSFLVTGRTYDLGYSMAGKTGTAEIGKTKTEELAWFICWRDNVPDEEARLVCIMLELDLTDGKIPTTTEISQMKFDIARAVLRKDVLNEGLSLNVSEE